MNKKSFFLFAILLAAAQSQLCALFNPFDAMASLTNAMTSASLVGGQAMGKLAMAGGQMAGQAMLTQQAVMNNLQQGMMAGQQGLQQGLAQGAAIGTQPVMQSNAPVGQGNAADQMGGGAGNGQQEAALQAQQAEQAQAQAQADGQAVADAASDMDQAQSQMQAEQDAAAAQAERESALALGSVLGFSQDAVNSQIDAQTPSEPVAGSQQASPVAAAAA